MVQKAAVHFIFWLLLLGGSSVYAQNRYSQAAEIDDSEFLSAVKEVSLNLQSDDSLAQYISLAAQRNEIVSALAGYGIAVRALSRRYPFSRICRAAVARWLTWPQAAGGRPVSSW
jgi:hypothetical protein